MRKLQLIKLDLFNETEEPVNEEEVVKEEGVSINGYERKGKPRSGIPDHLPREKNIYDLPEDEKFCPPNGAPLKTFGSSDHEQIEIIPAQIKALLPKRIKLARPCCE